MKKNLFIILLALLAVTAGVFVSACAVHEHDYRPEIINSTCSEKGYTLYSCDCGESYKEDYTDELGHEYDYDQISWTWNDAGESSAVITCKRNGCTQDQMGHIRTYQADIDEKIERDPTCTEEGSAVLSASIIVNSVTYKNPTTKKQILKKASHKEVSDNNGVKATCTAEGLTASASCFVCRTPLKPQEIIPKVPHTEVSEDNGIEPTCTSTGLTASIKCSVCGITVKEQQQIAELKHTYISQENQLHCDLCNGVNPIYKKISTSTDLQNISVNPDGKYYLANDIDLNWSNWTPICANGEFNGLFDGDGKIIRNLKYSVSGDSSKKNVTAGLFRVNAGTIRNLTVNNVSVTYEFYENNDNSWSPEYGSVSITFGSIVGNNKGFVTDCTVSGNVSMNCTRVLQKYFVWAKDAKEHTDKSTAYFGGLVGYNSGTVNGCVNSSNGNYTTYGHTQSMVGMLGGSPVGTWYVAFFGSIGGVVGSNHGKIDNCTVNNKFTYNSNLSANCVKNGPNAGWLVSTQNSTEAGTIAGYNSGSIRNCKSVEMKLNKNNSTSGSTGRTDIRNNVKCEGEHGFYGTNSNGSIDAIELL